MVLHHPSAGYVVSERFTTSVFHNDNLTIYNPQVRSILGDNQRLFEQVFLSVGGGVGVDSAGAIGVVWSGKRES